MKLKEMEVKYLETEQGKIPETIHNIKLWNRSSFLFKLPNEESYIEVRRYDDSFYGTIYTVEKKTKNANAKFISLKRTKWTCMRVKAQEINWEELELVAINECDRYSSGRCWNDETDYFAYNSKTLPYPQKDDVEGCGCDGWHQNPEAIFEKYKALGFDSMLVIKSYHDSSD